MSFISVILDPLFCYNTMNKTSLTSCRMSSKLELDGLLVKFGNSLKKYKEADVQLEQWRISESDEVVQGSSPERHYRIPRKRRIPSDSLSEVEPVKREERRGDADGKGERMGRDDQRERERVERWAQAERKKIGDEWHVLGKEKKRMLNEKWDAEKRLREEQERINKEWEQLKVEKEQLAKEKVEFGKEKELLKQMETEKEKEPDEQPSRLERVKARLGPATHGSRWGSAGGISEENSEMVTINASVIQGMLRMKVHSASIIKDLRKQLAQLKGAYLVGENL